ncbi:5-bromo-4-chloroindolyl phosphate hydrolysis family protein [Listeria costaricensis]|uniref:5-bromo-4-chloroindolyl phosphate hydrolysis family protein n=1 Tax=Listeria costaricensis TaxID=2026604 RepID=UPI000C082BBB|nr:5-bromo-4-chloroindolyl phosphate hydrolysis family protein [Listeria costaricensis]
MTLFKKIMAFAGSFVLISLLFGILSFVFTGKMLLILLITAVIAIVLFFLSSRAGDRALTEKTGLTKKEYKYIRTNLDEARAKIIRLQKIMGSHKTLYSFQERNKTLQLTKRIYGIVKEEPKRFYEAEDFFFSHLDSLVELTEKYAFLESQPVKDKKIYQTLSDTRTLLNDLSRVVEKDLFTLLNQDVNSLDFELEVAKNAVSKQKQKFERSHKE